MVEMYIVYTVPRSCVHVGARDAQATSSVCSRVDQGSVASQGLFQSFDYRVFPSLQARSATKTDPVLPYHDQEDPPGVNGTLPRIGSASLQQVTSTVSNFAASRHIPAVR